MKLKGKLTPKLTLHGTISKTADVIGSNIQPIRIYENGVYEASGGVDGFNPIYVDTPEPKEEQEKVVDITENGTVEVLPDENKVFSKVTVNASVPDTSEVIENIIDESGVLDSTEGTVEDKVGELIDKAQWDEFWYSASVYLNLNNNGPFRGSQYTNKTIPKIDFSQFTSLLYTFSGSGIEYIDYYINSAKCVNFSNTFSGCPNLKWIKGIDTTSATKVNDMFAYSPAIESIIEPLNFTNVTSFGKIFHGVYNLKDIRIVSESIKYSIGIYSFALTAESIQSIIDGLATVETAQTLTLNSAIVLTDEQKATINSKGWTLAQ